MKKYIVSIFVLACATIALSASANTAIKPSHVGGCTYSTTCGGEPYKCVTCMTCCDGGGRNCMTTCT